MTKPLDHDRRAVLAGPIAALLGFASLAGCSPDLPPRPSADHLLVEPVRLSHQVVFPDGTVELEPEEAGELAAFLNDADPDHRAEIYLDAQGPLRNFRLDVVDGLLDYLGRSSSGAGGVVAAEFTVTVTVVDDVFLPVSCLDGDQWPHPDLPPASCTSALTLIRMVEDPDDLLQGRELGPALSVTAARAASRHLQQRTRRSSDVPGTAATPPQQPAVPQSASTQAVSY